LESPPFHRYASANYFNEQDNFGSLHSYIDFIHKRQDRSVV